jgi:signal transduction histidine kinase
MGTTRSHRLGGMLLLGADVLPTFLLGLVIILASGKAAEDQLSARPLDAAAYAVLALAVATVPLRRHAPMAMLAAATMIISTYLALGYPYGPIILVLAVAAYSVAVRHPVRRVATAVVPATVIFVVGADLGGYRLLVGAGGDWLDWLALVAKSGFVLVPAFIGVLMQQSRTYAEQAKEEATRRKVEQERLRVAREVHDVVGHSLSIISLQAGVALHVLDRRPEQAQVALEAIRRTSLDALDELRATLALTRAGLQPGSPGVGSSDSGSQGAASTGDVRSGPDLPGRSPVGQPSVSPDLDRAGPRPRRPRQTPNSAASAVNIRVLKVVCRT